MKKNTIYLLMMVFLISFSPSHLFGSTVTNSNLPENTSSEVPSHVRVQLDRLDEIKSMDKSQLTSTEKKALRKEVKIIKSSLRDSNSGIYLSVGAIIIIVLLLILLL